MSAIGVLADDLTGALGSAARPRAGGLDPVVVWRAEDLPRATAATWAERLRKMQCTRFEQRIDPTLAGAPAEELAGLLDGADLRHAVVIAVPAWPDAGRTCTRGVQDGVNVGPAPFDAPAAVVPPEKLVERVRGGADRIVVDALGAQRLAVAGEIAPLCARGTLVGGDWSGLPVITQGARTELRALVDDVWRD